MKKKQLKKVIVEMEVICWNKRTKAQQDKVIFYLLDLINTLQDYRKTGISDDFTATY